MKMISISYWKDIENHKIFAEWLGKTLGYSTQNDWYRITADIIHENNGQGLMRNYYKNSPILFLRGVFPEKIWYEFKMKMTSILYWKDIENQKIYANWLGNELGYVEQNDWYNIRNRVINANFGGGLLANYYQNSSILFLCAMFPEVKWDKSKFKSKKYSPGQIEWLEYIKVSIPDIRHALNHFDGELKIHNSKFRADGYSEKENMVYEYHGDYWHGNPKIYKAEDINKSAKKTFGKLYDKTLEKQKHCIDNGYKYFSIWDSEWIGGKLALRKLQKSFKAKQIKKNQKSFLSK
jgi:hypothetical protein